MIKLAVLVLAIAGLYSLHAQRGPSRPEHSALSGLERTPGPKMVISGSVALASFVALSEGYLQKLADCYTLFASTAEARSADWEAIRTPLSAVAERNVSALVWFALPDGSYWSVQQGKSSANLSDRDYFQRVLAGETVIGAVVISKATGKASGIVAVPVRGEGNLVVGVLGASVYLDELSDRLDRDMDLGDNAIFYSFDATPLLALEWDPQLTFVDPFSLGPEIRAAFEYMLSRDEGTVRYRFRNQWRTVIFKRSQVTGWWYAFGEVEGNGARELSLNLTRGTAYALPVERSWKITRARYVRLRAGELARDGRLG